MAKTPFDIKYRPQIESGEYKVVIYMGNNPTEECPVEILKWDSNSDAGCIIGCFRVKGKDKLYVFDENGEHKVSGNRGNRLFIITPEPELTEFEQEVRNCITKNLTSYTKDGNCNEISSTVFIDDDAAKKMAGELLYLARKDFIKHGYVIEKKAFHDAVEKIDDKHKAEICLEYSLHCKVENGTRHAVINWNEFQKIAQHFIDYGKAEALKEIREDPESSYAFERGFDYGKEEALKELKKNLVDNDIDRVPEWLRQILTMTEENGRKEALNDLSKLKIRYNL